jgi:hypothetical protein
MLIIIKTLDQQKTFQMEKIRSKVSKNVCNSVKDKEGNVLYHLAQIIDITGREQKQKTKVRRKTIATK